MTVGWITDRRKKILGALYRSENGLTQRNIAEETTASDSTIAKAIDKLEELDLVRRDENRVYSLSDSGIKVTGHLLGIEEVIEE